MRVLVVTVVHDPRDARITARQVPAILAAGHEVTFAAPFAAVGVEPDPSYRSLDLPRAVGRRRGAALRAAHRLLRQEGPRHDIVMIHDPELLVVSGSCRTPTVWDVHEDPASAVFDREYLPPSMRVLSAKGFQALESWAERRLHLILAEHDYTARFAREHPVVPNTPVVPRKPPPAGLERRAVYVGRIARERGLAEMLTAAVRCPDVRFDLVGWSDSTVGEWMTNAPPNVVGSGPDHVPNEVALARVEGACVGLSLLHDRPNYRASLPTKILEYMAHGVPVITTPLPHARRLIEDAGCGVVVPYGGVDAVVDAVRRLVDAPAEARRLGDRGWRYVRDHHDWNRESGRFVRLLEGWARG